VEETVNEEMVPIIIPINEMERMNRLNGDVLSRVRGIIF
jgi:hypothetical protein